ncbi:uncharacterized protein [Branchiostoma lanceolatum]|uniref:uncharacterized protein n=1 Tax=Branchiostoma lanceolatum TaxID=7740 RepID=UPI003454487A
MAMAHINRRLAITVLVSFVAGMVIQMFFNAYEVSLSEGWPAITPYSCPVRFRVVGNCSCLELQSQLSTCHQTKFVTQFKSCHVPIHKRKTGIKGPKKVFLDCGANVASSVQLFRETYPDGHNYVIHSFELDERLQPYFAPYSNHVLHCPTAVSDKDGEMTAFSESAWSPDKGKNNGRDMQWGGGSLFVSEDEKKDTETGGTRKLSYRKKVPTVDLSRWIQSNFAVEDEIVFKLDVEGAEYGILKKMLKEDTFRWIDKFYGEFHPWQPTGLSNREKSQLLDELTQKKITQLSWAAEVLDYQDIEELHESKVPRGTSGTAGTIYRSCGVGSPSVPGRVSLVIEVGMNAKMAHRLIETIRAYRAYIPISIFVYGDFTELYPEMILNWSLNHTIGVREGHPYPPGHFDMINPSWIRTNLIISVLRLHELSLQPAFYLPASTRRDITRPAALRDLRVVYPTARFPPTKGTLLTYNNYYYYRSVERVPKALRMLSTALGQNGGIVSLDSDHPDSYMIAVFLLDYLVENSGFQLVGINDCVAGF